MRLLLTRPTPEAERSAEALHARGHDVVFAPMLEIENIPAVTLEGGPWSAVLMTSGNAARALAVHPRRDEIVTLRCFVVGRQTAEAARLAGFNEVLSANGDGGDLAQLVARDLADKSQPLLYLAGDDRARDMAAELASAGLRLETIVVYRAVAARRFAEDISAALQAGLIDGVLHYSRRSTAIFVACAREAGLTEAAARVKHFCLSARASEPLSEIGAKRILIAARTDEQAMLELVS
ncbi:MAG: uroporphyrinogen-III synthase [Pseudorhodoplanes sp.]